MRNNGWELIPFADAVDVASDEGKRVKQRDYLEDGAIPVIDQGETFIGGYTNDAGMAYRGDLPVIIFGDHTRRIKFVNRPFAVGADGVKILKPKPFYRPKFFYYQLKSLDIPSRGYSRHFQFLRNFDFVKVPPEDQDKVVAEIEKQFSRLDEVVAWLKRIQANLKRYRAAVLKAAVEGKLTEEWRKEHPDVEPADQLLKRILAQRRGKWEAEELAKMNAKGIKPKDDAWKKKYKEPAGPDTANLPELPDGWVWACIDQLAAPEPNSITDGPFGSNLKTVHYRESGPRVIRLQNIKDGKFADEYAHITVEHFERLHKHEIHAGDLVIASLGDNPPRACIIPSFVGPAIVKADCIRFKPHSALLSAYLNATLNCQPTRKRVKNVLHGIGRLRLSLGEIREISLPVPPDHEQHQITAEVDLLLSVTEELEVTIEANLRRAERLRQTILQQAFSGGLA